MTRLRDLDASFLKYNSEDGSKHRIDNIASADGIIFQCPKCSIGAEPFEKDGRKGFCGPHYVMCLFVGRVADDVGPTGRWIPSGTCLDDFTFVTSEDHPKCSVLMLSGCHWHGFLREGSATIDPN